MFMFSTYHRQSVAVNINWLQNNIVLQSLCNTWMSIDTWLDIKLHDLFNRTAQTVQGGRWCLQAVLCLIEVFEVHWRFFLATKFTRMHSIAGSIFAIQTLAFITASSFVHFHAKVSTNDLICCYQLLSCRTNAILRSFCYIEYRRIYNLSVW